MPVLRISQLTKDVKLGLWKIDESIDEFLSAYPHLEQVVSGYRHLELKRQKNGGLRIVICYEWQPSSRHQS